MALRAKKPEKIEKRLKAFFYGAAGVGKTTTAIQFPQPYLIDTERGSENETYIQKLRKGDGVIFQTSDYDEMVSEVKSLLTEKHQYKTLIIDPFTILYNDLLDKSAKYLKEKSKKNPDGDGTEMGRHYNEAARRMNGLSKLLFRLDMNVLITSHAKAIYSDDMKIIGQTFDCYKKMDYLFDLAVEVQKRGKERVGVVKKTRLEPCFMDGETFPFNYDAIADKYGRAILERDAIAEVLATPEQVSQIVHLIDILKFPEESYQKWLDKNNSETWEEMPSEAIQKCIDFLNEKLKPTAKTV